MMSNTLSSLPAAAGASILSSIGRMLLWTGRRFAAAPVTSTAMIGLTAGLAMAANNALFAQHELHPAPFFFGAPRVASTEVPVEAVPPVTIAPRPTARAIEPQPIVEAPQPTPVVEVQPTVPQPLPADTGEEVSNGELAQAQAKLQAMGLFDGEVDGFYGPKTAEAIRAFEMRNGMTPKGDMSRPVIDAILRATSNDHASINAARTTARTTQTPTPNVVVDPVATESLSSSQEALQALIAEPAAPVVETAEAEASPVVAAETPTAEAAALPVAQVASVGADRSPLANTELIETVQKGLASLGFLSGRIDGVAGEDTAKAIRNFEVFNNFEVTGSVTPELVDLLVTAGADI